MTEEVEIPLCYYGEEAMEELTEEPPIEDYEEASMAFTDHVQSCEVCGSR